MTNIVKMVNYEGLPESERSEWHDADDDHFLIIEYLGEETRIYSDGMCAEDVRFYRDLNWVAKEIQRAYDIGYSNGFADA